MKFSYLLYYFVLMFGYIALISPPTTDQGQLLKYFKLKDYELMIEKFKHLRKTQLGVDIIAANNHHGRDILRVVINCAKKLNINNDKLENGLTDINDEYLFKKETDAFNLTQNKSPKKQRLINIMSSDAESNQSELSNSQKRARLFKRPAPQKEKSNVNDELRLHISNIQEQNEQEKREYTNQLFSLQNEISRLRKENSNSKSRISKKRKNDKNNVNVTEIVYSSDEDIDQLIHIERENKNATQNPNFASSSIAVPSKYRLQLDEYSFDTEMKEIEEWKKSNMEKKIAEVKKGLNDNILNSLEEEALTRVKDIENLNYSQEDKKLIALYSVMAQFIKESGVDLMSDKERTAKADVIEQFCQNIDQKQMNYFEEIVNNIKYDPKEKSLNLLSDNDIDLITRIKAIEKCQNGEESANFYGEIKPDEEMELNTSSDE